MILASILTSLIGPVFIVLMILLTLWGAKVLIPPCVRSIAKNGTFKNVLNWIGVFLLAVLILVSLGVGLWTLQQRIVNPTTAIHNIDVHPSVEKSLKSEPLTKEDAKIHRYEAKDRIEKDHNDYLSDFDKKMQAEAEKIKNRNK